MRTSAGRRSWAALIGVALFLGAAAAAAAAPPPEIDPREAARLKMLDACVIEAARKAEPGDRFADRCRCITRAVVRALNEADIASYVSNGRMGGAIAEEWSKAQPRCA